MALSTLCRLRHRLRLPTMTARPSTTVFFGTSAGPKDVAAEITESRFETEATRTLERIFEAVENSSDAESLLHEGVLRVEFPDGVFILNKHALTKQIWYSSPVIGPAYFEALTATGKRWFSLKLERDVFDQFALDAKKLANVKIAYPHGDSSEASSQ